MSKLDQAFFKVYGQDVPPRATVSESKSELIRLSEALDRYSAQRAPIEGNPTVDSRQTHPQPAPAECELRPMLQVDAFAWPATVGAGTPAADAGFDAVASALVEVARSGSTTVALAGTAPGSGCTTLLLGAARRLARQGVSVVLVDGNETKPDLGPQLGLLPTLGWEDVASGAQPLAEVLIESIGDGMTLLPLCRVEAISAAAGAAVTLSRMTEAMTALQRRYDLVLVDLGVPGRGVAQAMDQSIDEAVLVHNVQRATSEDLRAATGQLAARRIRCAGVIENCVKQEASSSYRRAA